MSVNRRRFLAGSVVGMTAGLASGISSVALAKPLTPKPTHHSTKNTKKVTWNCLVSWPTQLDLLYSGATSIAQKVSDLSGGNFTINLLADGSVNKDIDLMDAVSKGLVQCGHTASDYFSERNNAMNFFTSMPFGLMADEHLAWWQHGGGQQLSDELYGKYNIKLLPAGNTGPQMGGWFNKKINRIEDLSGLKFRITGMSAQVLKQMGAIPTSVPFLQLADAMKSGKINALEFVGPYDDKKLGIDKVAQYYYAPGWWQVGDSLELYINKDAYQALPKQFQEILEIACYDTNLELFSTYNYKNAVALKAMQQEGKVSLQQFPLQFLRESYDVVQKIHAENAQKNPDYQRIYQSWQPFVNQSTYWRNYIGKSMMNF